LEGGGISILMEQKKKRTRGSEKGKLKFEKKLRAGRISEATCGATEGGKPNGKEGGGGKKVGWRDKWKLSLKRPSTILLRKGTIGKLFKLKSSN